MKKTIFTSSLTALIISFLLSSCSIERRHYTSGYYMDAKSKRNNSLSKSLTKSNSNSTLTINSTQELTTETASESVDSDPTVNIKSKEGIILKSTPNKSAVKALTNYLLKEDKCDEIILRDGGIINAKVTEIGTEEIKYKKCDNLEGPTIAVKKNDVFMIKYSNGTTDVFKEEVKPQEKPSGNTIKKAHPLAVASLITGLVGLLFGLLVSTLFGIGLGILAIIFGGIALSKINKQPEKFSGKGLAITGLVTGILLVLVFAALVFLIASFLL